MTAMWCCIERYNGRVAWGFGTSMLLAIREARRYAAWVLGERRQPDSSVSWTEVELP
jgi:hypothetical protein